MAATITVIVLAIMERVRINARGRVGVKVRVGSRQQLFPNMFRIPLFELQQAQVYLGIFGKRRIPDSTFPKS